MQLHSAFLTALFLPGCFSVYGSMADLPPAQRSALASSDAYYFQKAKEQAAFSLNCPSAQVTVSAVSTKPERRLANRVVVEAGTRIVVIGAEGCDRRTTYSVLCGPDQFYDGLLIRKEQDLCDVIPSNEAAQVVDRNNRDQQELNARRAAEAAQPAAEPAAGGKK